MTAKKKVTVTGTKANPPVGILIEGSKAAVETMTQSIVTVLGAVKANDMDDEVAISALEVLEAVAENPVDVTVRDCHIEVKPSDS